MLKYALGPSYDRNSRTTISLPTPILVLVLSKESPKRIALWDCASSELRATVFVDLADWARTAFGFY